MGIWNSLYGPHQKSVPLVRKYMANVLTSKYEWGLICGMPSIVTKTFTKKDVIKLMKSDCMCTHCDTIHRNKGRSDPSKMLKHFGKSIP